MTSAVVRNDPIEFSPQDTPRVLNVKAAVILVCVVGVIVVCARMLHDYQYGRTVEFLRGAADGAYEEQRYADAVEMLDAYLLINPVDADARDLLLKAIRSADTSTAGLQRQMDLQEEILLEEPDRLDIRKNQIRIALKLRRMPDAEAHLKLLLEHSTVVDAESHWLAGQYYEATESLRQARAAYEAAIVSEEIYGKASACLARLSWKQERETTAADLVMDELVERAGNAESYTLRGEWLLDTSRPAAALVDLRMALGMIDSSLQTGNDASQLLEQLPPVHNDEVPAIDRSSVLRLLIQATAAAANVARRTEGEAAEKAVLRPTISLLSENADSGGLTAELSMLLASLRWTSDDRDAATLTLSEALRRYPDHARIQRMLVDVLLAQRKFDEAERVFRTIAPERMDRADYAFMRARLLMARGDTAEAIQILQMIVNGLALDRSLRERAQTALAIASSESGDSNAAFDEFRLLVQQNPETERGRLGLAAGYVAQGRHDLAIAEYRQLMYLPEVPPYLAHLLIDQAMTLPISARRWDEVEELLRDNDPLVADALQREILKTDMAFGQGRIGEALRRLAEARRRFQNRAEAGFAARFLRQERTEQVEAVLREKLSADPLERLSHIELLLFRMATGRSEEALRWLGGVVNGDFGVMLPEADRRRLAIDVAVAAADEMQNLEITTSSAAAVAALDGLAEQWLRAMSSEAIAGNDLLRHAQFLIKRDRWLDAFEVVAEASTDVPSEVRGAALLELDRSMRQAARGWASDRESADEKNRLAESIGKSLLTLVEDEPQSIPLRLQLAELLIRHNELDAAENTYFELMAAAPDDAAVVNNLAWLLSVREVDVAGAVRLSEQALRLDPDSLTVRETRAAALLAAGRTGEALSVLDSVPPESRHAVSNVREAVARFRNGEKSAARRLLQAFRDAHADSAMLTPPEAAFVDRAILEISESPSST